MRGERCRMMPKIPIFSSHLFLLSLVFFCLVISPVNAVNTSCADLRSQGYETSAHYFPNDCSDLDLCPYRDMTVTFGWAGSCQGPIQDCGRLSGYWIPCGEPEPTPTPTPTPSQVCYEACGHTFESGCSPADETLGNLIYWWFNGPLTGAGCAASGWQWSMLETQCPCEDETPDPVPEPPNWTPHPDPGPVYPEPSLPPSEYSPNTVMINPLSLIPRIDPIPEMNTTELRTTITEKAGNWSIPYMDWSDGVASIVTQTVTPISRLVNSPLVTINIYLLTWLELFDSITTALLGYAEAVTTVMGLAMDSLTDGVRLNLIYGLLLVFILLVIRKNKQGPGDE